MEPDLRGDAPLRGGGVRRRHRDLPEVDAVHFPPVLTRAGESVTLVFSFLCDLCPQNYTLTLASHDSDGTAHDWLDDAVAFSVVDERPTAGVANLRAKVVLEPRPEPKI